MEHPTHAAINSIVDTQCEKFKADRGSFVNSFVFFGGLFDMVIPTETISHSKEEMIRALRTIASVVGSTAYFVSMDTRMIKQHPDDPAPTGPFVENPNHIEALVFMYISRSYRRSIIRPYKKVRNKWLVTIEWLPDEYADVEYAHGEYASVLLDKPIELEPRSRNVILRVAETFAIARKNGEKP